jgi:putative photosynthetic complex assembly protein
MSDPFHDNPLPRATVWAAGALLALSIGAAAFTRHTGIGAQSPEEVRIVHQRSLRFEDRADGSVAVLDAATGRPLVMLPAGSHGFVRATLRSFARERRQHGIGEAPPFTLGVLSDGRLQLADAATGRRVGLEAFGPDNAAAFARLLGDRAAGL